MYPSGSLRGVRPYTREEIMAIRAGSMPAPRQNQSLGLSGQQGYSATSQAPQQSGGGNGLLGPLAVADRFGAFDGLMGQSRDQYIAGLDKTLAGIPNPAAGYSSLTPAGGQVYAGLNASPSIAATATPLAPLGAAEVGPIADAAAYGGEMAGFYAPAEVINATYPLGYEASMAALPAAEAVAPAAGAASVAPAAAAGTEAGLLGLGAAAPWLAGGVGLYLLGDMFDWW